MRLATLLVLVVSGLTACSALPTAGPAAERVAQIGQAGAGTQGAAAGQTATVPGIRLVDVSPALNQRLGALRAQAEFAQAFGDVAPDVSRLGRGDAVEVSVWEAAPATLLAALDSRGGSASGGAAARAPVLPEAVIDAQGLLSVPFAGSLRAEGLTLAELEAEITRRLQGKAHAPQVSVRLLRNASAQVTVVGDVASATRLPLSLRGERVLDAIAAAGGVRQPVGKVTVQLTRGEQVRAMPLSDLIGEPRHNVRLRPGDVVTALHQPLAFVAFGATGKNEEVPFEGQGITLAQALARAGGLLDARADAKGVFVFRYESPRAFEGAAPSVAVGADGRVPVVYRIDFSDPASFFLVQGFPVQHGDVLYVSNAPVAEVQKFLNLVFSVTYPVLNLINATR